MTWRRTAGGVLVLLPVLIQTILVIREIRDWLPVWAWYPDPGYHYLLSGVVITSGDTPLHTDHPGTSLQWLIGGTERLTYLVGGQAEFATDVVARPEFYAQSVSIVLASLYVSALVYAALRLRRFFGTWASLAFQLVLLWGLPILAVARYRLMPESLVLTCALVALALVAPALVGRNREITAGAAVGLGVVAAIGITAKIVFLPIVALIVLVLPWRRLVVFLGSLAIGGTFILLAIVPRLGSTVNWFLGLATNPGRQGQAETSWEPLTQLSESMATIGGFVRWFITAAILILAIALAPLLLDRRGESAASWRGFGAMVVSLAIALAAGIKPAEPRDFLLVIPLLAALAASGLYWIGLRASGRTKVITLGVVTLLIAFLGAHGVVGSVYFGNANAANVRSIEASAPAVDAFVTDFSSGLGYGVRTEMGSLLQTIPWMNGAALSAIGAREPNGLYFDLWAKGFVAAENAGTPLDCARLVSRHSTESLGIIVESQNHLHLDDTGTNILLSDAQATFEEPVAIGPYFVYRLVDITCPG